MIRRKFFILGSLIFCMTSLLQGCIKIDTLPQLEILVLDENNGTLPGACVALFDSPEEWASRINPVQVWRMTDEDGRVMFIDLREIPYYIYVRFDGKDNSVKEVYTTEPLQLNQKRRIVVHVR